VCELVPNLFDVQTQLGSDTNGSAPKLHFSGHLLELRGSELF